MYKIPKCRINSKKNNVYIKITHKEKDIVVNKIKKKNSDLPRKFGQDITNIPKQIQTQNSKLVKTRKISRKASSYNEKLQIQNNTNINRNKKIFPNRIHKCIISNQRNSIDKKPKENSNNLANYSNLNNHNYYSINMNHSQNFRSSIPAENNNCINKYLKNNTIDNNYFGERKRYKVLSNRTLPGRYM